MNQGAHPMHPTHEDYEQAFKQAQEHQWADEYAQQEPELSPEDQKMALAMTAERLVNSIQDPKIQNSKFMAFMRQLKDQVVTIEGNKVVEVKGCYLKIKI